MKKILSFFVLLFAFSAVAQVIQPVKWQTAVEDNGNETFTLVFTGKIDAGWHVYSQTTPDGGPLPLLATYEAAGKGYDLIGKTTESKTKRAFNDVFGVDEVFFEGKVVLRQKISRKNPKIKSVVASLSYQVCEEKCINEDKTFTFSLPEPTVSTPVASESNTVTAVDTVSKAVDTAAVVTNVATSKKVEKSAEIKAEKSDDKSIWSIFLLAFLGGIVATITPCVFPMIPMTVSFFLKQSGSKAKGRFNAIFYGFCIVLICVLITLPFHLLEGANPDVFSEISTNVWLNVFFFIIFSIFAVSFFGAFEITMPSALANKVDSASDRGGKIGIFFMALTLIIVSFSCIGPALGFVLGTSLNSDGGAWILSLAMLGFGLGLALPFMFFALAPSLLGNLPKSGGWLNTVKVVFGFIELALAFKFLSNADLVLNAHYLEREVFIAIWVAIFGSLSLYLFGKIRFPHDSPLDHLSVSRALLAVLTFSFTVYLIPGLWGAPLKLISAFPPPLTYSESPNGFGASVTTESATALPDGAVAGPHGIASFEEYEAGLAYAKKVGKPVLIDFTGRACQNCRLMEANVWSDQEVLKILKNEVVLISLFGDERTKLPEAEQYISKETGNKIATVGQKWSEFQRQRYGTNARPYYVLMNHEENILNEPVAYTPDIDTYLSWLKEGVKKF
ncbi:protein-disulfide reductase DsbD family protein [Flavobacterium aurantiibacter]|uniref:Thiol:disulfide interchange protein n=1 Tax=Flavobacterium aurantiibacter TaxID=2023067 RepID=A0A255ZGS9_9FLAO|nr:thioredoxin family protein [Flavobacterium aurantiibacter]OYQ40641.1 thiol:disulfide interchange protein [Flavobacterium aurantiibacter]